HATARALPLCRPRQRHQDRGERSRESRLLARFSRRRRHEPPQRACPVRPSLFVWSTGRPSLRRAEAEARFVAAPSCASPDLAARRAVGLARRRLGQSAGAADRGAPAPRRHRRHRQPHAAQGEIHPRAETRGTRPMRPWLALLTREIGLAWREGGAIGTALGFYLVVVAITPLGLGPDLNLLSRIAPGVLWVALLLASLLSADRIVHNDYEDGTLDVLTPGPLPLAGIVAIKSLSHWITTGIPLALLAPILGLLLNFPIASSPLLVLAMLAGTPAVSFIAAIGASLTLGLRRSGVLLALLVLPLYVPVLIFGVSTVSAAVTGPASPWPPLLMLSAFSLPSLVLAPLAAAAAIRNALR